jgi:hypothetical protein
VPDPADSAPMTLIDFQKEIDQLVNDILDVTIALKQSYIDWLAPLPVEPTGSDAVVAGALNSIIARADALTPARQAAARRAEATLDLVRVRLNSPLPATPRLAANVFDGVAPELEPLRAVLTTLKSLQSEMSRLATTYPQYAPTFD